MTDTEPVPALRRRLGFLLWSAGTLGAAAVTIGVLPRVSATMPLPAPLWLITAASILQSAVLVAVAVWVGVRLGPTVGLRAPVFDAAAASRPILSALGPQVLPGLVAGLVGGPLLSASLRLAPTRIADLRAQFDPPLYARMIYGGITEELLLRWGLMTAVAWLAWRLFQSRRGAVRPVLMWLAIAASAVLFGAGHLPVAFFLAGSLNAQLVAYVVGLNAAFGLLFGWLFWRWGLEAAMIAHATTHLAGHLATQLAAVMPG